nr:immunoglobulin heavy chain junction region [Macaca mulatta]MOX00068.1 immunoglobulin heavy chain junction region [Macaca mulatta]MOX03305.1 immunoglobulin heavy chain junction region [Macaca mulatta]MOX04317.1 immunoglobulin heavy chain junction region [Macaca mulatta]MOX05315.1 immunoglobulin heavy chain junction region [Macaca mulatta]
CYRDLEVVLLGQDRFDVW